MKQNIGHYTVKLFSLDKNGKPTSVKYKKSGFGEPPQAIILDGFSENRYVDLRPHWQEIIDKKTTHYIAEVSTYETITKFGDTMQLVNHYKLLIEN